MLQRDYLTEMVRRFANVLARRLRAALLDTDPEAIKDLEDAVGSLLDLDGVTAMSLDPSSLVTMMELSGVADSLASYANYALRRIADAYAAQGQPALAQTRRVQADAVCTSFLCEPSFVPAELAELDASLGEH